MGKKSPSSPVASNPSFADNDSQSTVMVGGSTTQLTNPGARQLAGGQILILKNQKNYIFLKKTKKIAFLLRKF